MKKILIISILFTIFYRLDAQYNNAIGLRLGVDTGLSFKHNFTENIGIEIMGIYRWSGFGAVILMEHQNNLGNSGDFYLFYGYGAHIVSYDGKYISSGIGDGSFMVAGIDIGVGIEYKISGGPFSLVIDVRPAYDIIGRRGLASGGAFTVRYAF